MQEYMIEKMMQLSGRKTFFNPTKSRNFPTVQKEPFELQSLTGW